jgi:hypothetical protein
MNRMLVHAIFVLFADDPAPMRDAEAIRIAGVQKAPDRVALTVNLELQRELKCVGP